MCSMAHLIVDTLVYNGTIQASFGNLRHDVLHRIVAAVGNCRLVFREKTAENQALKENRLNVLCQSEADAVL